MEIIDSVIKIKSISEQERCDVCHKSDKFDPVKRHCSRCKQIAFIKAKEQPSLRPAPLPEFLSRRFSPNVAIRCCSCGEFIMSLSPACRHCGAFVRLQDTALATKSERRLTEAFEQLHHCKAASSLSFEFVRLHLWGFPLTLLLTPLSAAASLILFLRTLWLGLICRIKLSTLDQKTDPRIKEGKREVLITVSKSAGVFAIVATLGAIVLYSGLIELPHSWDSYSKGRHEYDMRRYKDAEQLFQTVVKTSPKYVDARLYYARSIWNQYINNVNADQARNEEIAARAVTEFSNVLELTEDLKIKDEVYNQIAEIYKTTNNREKFEQWMLDRTALPNQSQNNISDSYVKLGAIYSDDISTLLEKYRIKNSYPRAWHPSSEWESVDIEKARTSSGKAIYYLNRALNIFPKHEVTLSLFNQLQKDLNKVEIVPYYF
jgi:tetratricopeptide (TPR) repeat protein